MRRREFITLLGGAAAAWPLAARAQQPAMPVIGFSAVSRRTNWRATWCTRFRQGLNEAGYVEGQNVAIEYRWADGRIRSIAGAGGRSGSPPGRRDRRRRHHTAALAAKAATTTIPIVFAIGGDPVEVGLVASLNRPGGNVTGVMLVSAELGAKRLELLRELLPNAARYAVLVNPDQMPTPKLSRRDAGRRPHAHRVVLVHIRARQHRREIDAAFAAIARTASRTRSWSAPIHSSTAGAISSSRWRRAMRFPRSTPCREFAAAGGLMSYGTSLADLYRQAGIYAGRILKGEKPPTCRSSSRPSSSWSSTSRPPRRSASTCRRRCSPAPTR